MYLKLEAAGCNVTSTGYLGANCTGTRTFKETYPTVSGSVVLLPRLRDWGCCLAQTWSLRPVFLGRCSTVVLIYVHLSGPLPLTM